MPKVLTKEEFADRELTAYKKTVKREFKAKVAELVASAKDAGDKAAVATTKATGAELLEILTAEPAE